MKKLVLLVIAAAVAASPAVAAKKSKKKAPEPTVYERNEAGIRLARESLPLFLPSWAMPIYFSQQKAAEPKKATKARKRK